MSERNDIHAEFTRSPRVILVEKDSEELTMQDLVDTLKGIIERSWIGIDDPYLHSSGGKEVLDPETNVGITVTLQNAQIAFESRNDSISFATATDDDPNGVLLTDTNADFVTDGIAVGDTIINFTDLSVATVIEVLSLTQLKHYKLVDGTNNDWNIGDTYKVFHIAQCNITGGNLVAVDDVGDPISAISPTAFTQIILTKSSSATLGDLLAIQYASYNGGVTIDVINGVSGTTYNIGTTENPVNNLADAQAIADERGFNKLYILGNITFGATDNIDDLVIVGESPILTLVTITAGCSTNGTEFKDCTLTGTLSDSVEIRNCKIGVGGLIGFYGDMYNSGLVGNITLGGTSSNVAQLVECYQASVVIGAMEFDMIGDGPALALRAHTGAVKIKNKSGDSKVAIDFLSGRLELMDTVTAGTFFVRGIGEISINDATGITLYDNSLTNPAKVWDESRSEHVAAGSFGEMGFILGLVQSNFRILNPVYNEKRNLTSGKIRIYANATDCENDTNHINEYQINAEYDEDGNCTSYKVKEM